MSPDGASHRVRNDNTAETTTSDEQGRTSEFANLIQPISYGYCC